MATLKSLHGNGIECVPSWYDHGFEQGQAASAHRLECKYAQAPGELREQATLEGQLHPIIEIHTRKVCETSAGVHYD